MKAVESATLCWLCEKKGIALLPLHWVWMVVWKYKFHYNVLIYGNELCKCRKNISESKISIKLFLINSSASSCVTQKFSAVLTDISFATHSMPLLSPVQCANMDFIFLIKIFFLLYWLYTISYVCLKLFSQPKSD